MGATSTTPLSPLSPRDALIVELTRRGGISRKEIARRVGCGVATVAHVRKTLGVRAPRGAKRDRIVQVKITDAEHAQLVAFAKRLGTTYSGALRHLLSLANDDAPSVALAKVVALVTDVERAARVA